MSRSSLRRNALLATALTVALTTAACSGDAEPESEPSKPPASSGKPTEKPREVTFGAYGTDEEVAAFQSVVDSFNASSTTRKVTLKSWPDHESAVADVLAGNAPDAFLTSRIDLDQLVEGEALQPVSLLLDERGVDFGDRFSRDAVDAFAMDDELQCMAYSVSPMVIYYNTDIVDFDRMERRGFDVPTANSEGKRERWTLAQFGAAAQFASRRGDRRGVWIDPTLQGLAPFIYSGDGQVFDDDREPTSLAFSDDNTREALSETLAILRDSALTPTNAQLARATPVQLFKRGELAMVAGFRNLVPQLRDAEDLDFDVLPMPSIDTRATVGDISGLCISADSEVVNDAADFIAYAVSDAAIATVASTGYIVPANTSVAASPDFLAPEEEPASSEIYNQSIRYMVVPPFIDQREELIEAVTPLLEQLVTAPGPLDLEGLTEEIDTT
ncbi:MAG: extracellular solute-binding protein, partial [Terrabacter sp.]|nr:extracellular solute-binding protein [Terrabacter sp.]